MPRSKSYAALVTIGMALIVLRPALAGAAEWPPISKDELSMTDDPVNPGAAAILLYREVTTDDPKGIQTEYRRLKVLTDEGKKYADIEIPYVEKFFQVENIQARTIRPDGSAVNFSGQTFDRTVVKARRTRVHVKAFTLPEVQKGSIIEYSYTERFHQRFLDVLNNPEGYIFDTSVAIPSASWVIQDDLFTRRARFSVRPFPKPAMLWRFNNIPGDKRPQTQADGSRVLEFQNFPAFQEEESMPPEEYVKGRVSFYYLLGGQPSADYWDRLGETEAKELAPFFGDSKKLKQVVDGVVSAADSPNTQLQKLYARVQQIRYLSYEPSKTEQEVKRENLKDNKNVEDILKHGYAYVNEINLALVALARAAGFQSAPVRIKSRDTGFFSPDLPGERQLDAMVVWVRAGDKDYFLDPATQYCPFGVLPWPETGTTGIALIQGSAPIKSTQSSGGYFNLVTTPLPSSSQAVVQRKAELQLDSTGAAAGTISVSFTGQEALSRRIFARNIDETARKKLLEDEVKEWAPAGATIELKGAANWTQSEEPLRATFDAKIADYATVTGRRFLFRGQFFRGAGAFKAETRTYPVYFAHPLQESDEVSWKVPQGYRLASVPAQQTYIGTYGNYAASFDGAADAVRSTRNFTVDAVVVPTPNYSLLRTYFAAVRQFDDRQVVLEKGEAPNAK